MASVINNFLKTEVTFVPSLLTKYLSTYYDNTLCNGATWMFILWGCVHMLFDHSLDALFLKMKYKEYLRIRLKQSLWYLSFYGTVLVYCVSSLLKSKITCHNNCITVNENKCYLILGMFILTFLLHNAFWEGIKYCRTTPMLGFLSLFGLISFAYFLRFVGGSLKLTIMLASTHVILELTRCITLLINLATVRNKMCVQFLLAANIFIFFFSYILVLPIVLGYPLLLKYSNIKWILLLFLLGWLMSETCESVLYKSIFHWLYHSEESETEKLYCNHDLVECTLFGPRDDTVYNLQMLRQEIEIRKKKSMSMRKSKNKNMVMQTLKCMVAIKRKLKQKRSVNEDSDNTTSNTCETNSISNNIDKKNEEFENLASDEGIVEGSKIKED